MLETNKTWGPPAGGSKHNNNGIESPYQTVAREWAEETGLPMSFSSQPHLHDVLQSYDSQQNRARVGFIYSATLENDFADKHFDRSDTNILILEPRPVETGFETDMVGLFNYHAIMDLLEDWKNNIYLPEINGDTLLNWCNSLAGAYAELYFSYANWSVSREELGFNWQILSIKS